MGALKPHQYKIIGMQKDNSISAFDPKYSYDNKNIRITSLDGNTQLSVVNEKGTSLLSVINTLDGNLFTIIGKPIGYNVIDEELILFTTQSTEEDITTSTSNNIYKLNRLTASIIGGYLGIDYEIVNVINPLPEENLFTIEIVIHEFIRDNNEPIKINPLKTKLSGSYISGVIPHIIHENTELITINKVTVKYNDEILYTNYVHEYFQKPERSLSFNTLKEIIPSLNVLHINFPYYSNPSETIDNSDAVLIPSPKKLKVINGKDISNNDAYITTPNSTYTTNHYLFAYKSDDTFERISGGLTSGTPIDNYNLVYYYAPKVISRVFFNNRINDIVITDFPTNVNIEQEYEFTIKLNYEGNPNLVSKDLNIFFDKKYILTMYKSFDINTDTYTIRFKANMNVSNGEAFIYIQSTKYPNINKSLSFNIKNYRVPITLYEDYRVVTDVVFNMGKTLIENTFTVDTNRPYTITASEWITYVAINTNTYEITGDDDGYKLGSITIQYDDETEGTEIIVEQVPNANITSTELIVDCDYNTIFPLATLNDIVTCRVYATSTETYSYSGQIKVTYPTGFELLNIIKKIESINEVKYLVHYYTFQVINVIHTQVAIDFSINNIENPITADAKLFLISPPKIPEEIITTTPQDFVIKLGEEVTIDAFVNPSGTNNIGESTGLYLENTNLYTDLITEHDPNKTTFKFKLNTIPEQQVITIYSYDNPNIFKHIPYQVEYINN